MIDEQVLERALRTEADTYPLPPAGPERIRAAAAERRPRPHPRRGGWALAAAAAAVVVGVAGVSVVSGAGDGAFPASGRVTGLSGGADDRPNALDEETSGGTVGQKQDASVVSTGEVTLEVADVPDALGALTRLASARRGFVADSRTDGTPESPQGTVTLRVPAAAFDATVAEASRLGRVVASSTSGTDVSGEVTDVAARLKSLTAARAQLQTLLAQARNVGEVLAVQQRLTETQTQIEQLQARQESLRDRTTYGTLSVSVYEEGALDPGRSGFAKAWHDAVDGFVSAAQALVAASGTIAFVLLALALLTLLLRPVYRAWVRRLV